MTPKSAVKSSRQTRRTYILHYCKFSVRQKLYPNAKWIIDIETSLEILIDMPEFGYYISAALVSVDLLPLVFKLMKLGTYRMRKTLHNLEWRVLGLP